MSMKDAIIAGALAGAAGGGSSAGGGGGDARGYEMIDLTVKKNGVYDQRDQNKAFKRVLVQNPVQIEEVGFDLTALMADKLKNLDDVNGVLQELRNYAFYSCSHLTSVDLPAATSIGNYAFYSCSSLTSVDLPAATSIGDNAFYSCSHLTSVDLPAATSIGVYAFQSCSRLKEIHVGKDTGKVCTLSGNLGLPSTNALESIYVPADLVEDYKKASNWSLWADYIKAEPESEAQA